MWNPSNRKVLKRDIFFVVLIDIYVCISICACDGIKLIIFLFLQGLAFQLIDDVLDFTGTSASLGKGSLSDIRHVSLSY